MRRVVKARGRRAVSPIVAIRTIGGGQPPGQRADCFEFMLHARGIIIMRQRGVHRILEPINPIPIYIVAKVDPCMAELVGEDRVEPGMDEGLPIPEPAIATLKSIVSGWFNWECI